MSRRLLSLLPVLVAFIGACSSESADRAGASGAGHVRRVSQPIINGTPSTAASDSVVSLSTNGQPACTGTLIAANLVLTARHCVAEVVGEAECASFAAANAASQLAVSLGVQPGAPVATGTKIFVDPSQNGTCSNDIALLQLNRDIPDAKISKVRFTKLTIGEPARTAGYGENEAKQPTNGRYERLGIKIDSVGPGSFTYQTRTGQSLPVTVPAGEIVTGESTCFGDSGGPLFDGAGNVIGVTSRGIDEECIDRPSIYSDTASHEKLIIGAASAAGHPLQGADVPGQQPPSTGPTSTEPGGDENDGAQPDTTTLGEDEDTPAPKKKKALGSVPPSAGCTVAAGTPASSPIAPLPTALLAIGAILVLRRRARSVRPLL
jgi:MYXO-CTERM domain-containing protein